MIGKRSRVRVEAGAVVPFGPYLDGTGPYQKALGTEVVPVVGDAKLVDYLVQLLPFSHPAFRFDFGFNEELDELRRKGVTDRRLRSILTVAIVPDLKIELLWAFGFHAFSSITGRAQLTDGHVWGACVDLASARYLNPVYQAFAKPIFRILVTLTNLRHGLTRPDQAKRRLIWWNSERRPALKQLMDYAVRAISRFAEERPDLLFTAKFWKTLSARSGIRLLSGKSAKMQGSQRQKKRRRPESGSKFGVLQITIPGHASAKIRLSGPIFASRPPLRELDLPLPGETDADYRRRLTGMLRSFLQKRRHSIRTRQLNRKRSNRRIFPVPDPILEIQYHEQRSRITAAARLARAADSFNQEISDRAARLHRGVAERLRAGQQTPQRTNSGRSCRASATAGIVEASSRALRQLEQDSLKFERWLGEMGRHVSAHECDTECLEQAVAGSHAAAGRITAATERCRLKHQSRRSEKRAVVDTFLKTRSAQPRAR